MDPVTTSVISDVIYGLIKHGVSLSREKIASALTQYITSDRHTAIIADKISQLDLDRGMSEFAIEEKIRANPELLEVINSLPASGASISQVHYGNGDNIAGNKYGR